MIKQYSNKEKDIVLNHIEAVRAQFFYLYMDLKECGCEDEGLGLWVSEKDDRIAFIIYRYYDTLHLFGEEADLDEEVIEKIKSLEPGLLYGSVPVITKLSKVFSVDESEIEKNLVITAEKYLGDDNDEAHGISQAEVEDLPYVAELMLKDDLYRKVYSYDQLLSQLENRLKNGFGRVFVLRRNGKILAANATYAETEDLAVVGGLITDPEARGQGLGRIITASTWDRVKREGKQGLAFLEADNIKTINLHRKMGYAFLGESARIILKK